MSRAGDDGNRARAGVVESGDQGRSYQQGMRPVVEHLQEGADGLPGGRIGQLTLDPDEGGAAQPNLG